VLEQVIGFDSARTRLLGILSRPAEGAPPATDPAVLIVVGGPQYRVGSHRQFVSLARALARAGFATLRFDLTGMGDSEGDKRSFEAAGPDIRSAIDALSKACPEALRIVVWGLCDGASAAMMFATDDRRVAGLIAANPWARSEASLATTRLKHYYVARLLQREFWAKLVKGGLQWRDSLRALLGSVRDARAPGPTQDDDWLAQPFQTAMARGLAKFRGRLLLILSGNDLTAKEFIEFARSSRAWRGLLERPTVSRIDLPDADHTFSRREWQRRVETDSIAWLSGLSSAPGHSIAQAGVARKNP